MGRTTTVRWGSGAASLLFGLTTLLCPVRSSAGDSWIEGAEREITLECSLDSKGNPTFLGWCEEGNFAGLGQFWFLTKVDDEFKGLGQIALSNVVLGDFIGVVQFGVLSQVGHFKGFSQLSISNEAKQVTGTQIGLVNATRGGKDNSLGLQLGGWNSADDWSGVVVGAVNLLEDTRSLEVGLVNSVSGDCAGVQIGLRNSVANMDDWTVQIGLWNSIEGGSGHLGLQIGLLNWGPDRFFPLVNLHW